MSCKPKSPLRITFFARTFGRLGKRRTFAVLFKPTGIFAPAWYKNSGGRGVAHSHSRHSALCALATPYGHRAKSESIEEACLDRIVHKAIKYALSGESLRKSINFAADTEDRQRTERISPELVNGYRPEYARTYSGAAVSSRKG